MADPKVTVRRPGQLPSVLGDIGTASDLPGGNHWFGLQRDVLDRNRQVVEKSSAYLAERRRQADNYTSLIDARMRIAKKIAELVDLPNLITDEQKQREHVRWLADRRRDVERLQAVYDHKVATARNDAELAAIQEKAVRAARNHEAAQRVKDAEIDRWYAEAQARANNAAAEFQDTVADLNRTQPATDPAAAADGAAKQHTQYLAVLDHEIELESQRRNAAAVLALTNLRARLQASS